MWKGFPGLTAKEQAAAWAQWCAAAQRRHAAKAAKAVARSTDRATTIAEEMGQAVGCALDSQAVGHTWEVIVGHRSYQSELIRCVFGNPFRPTPIAAARLTPDVIRLAANDLRRTGL